MYESWRSRKTAEKEEQLDWYRGLRKLNIHFAFFFSEIIIPPFFLSLQGVISARGKAILFADGDGATKFSDLVHMEEILSASGAGKDVVVVGSRAHLEKRAVAEVIVCRSTFIQKMIIIHVTLSLGAIQKWRQPGVGGRGWEKTDDLTSVGGA